MSETSHRFGSVLPGVPGFGAFEAEGGFITEKWTIGRTAAQIEDNTTP